MAMQMILCVETTKKANTDSVYILDTIKFFYNIGNEIKINSVYMGTKSKYKSKDILKEISQKIKDFSRLGETKVIYCIDTDEYEKNTEHEKDFNNISKFCKNNNYDLIWFCHDVEEVFIGNKVSDSEKVQKASIFRRKKNIEKMDVEKLSSNNIRIHTSNILNVLDQYLPRK